MHALRYRFANVFRVDALQRFGDDIWIVDGPTVRFFGAPLPTRMAVVKLADGSLWIDSPVVATAEQVGKLAQIGPVAHLVSPTRLHDWRLDAWAEFFPQAQVWKAAMLDDEPPPAWKGQIDQTRFRGSAVLSEVEFFHRRSRTLVVADFAQNFRLELKHPIRNALLRLGGVANGGAPRDLRLSFFGAGRRAGRESVRNILSWDFDKVVVAHGDCVDRDAKTFVERSFRWLGI
jgi:hypothetical protein